MTGTHPIPFLDLGAATAEQRDGLDSAWETVLEHGRFVGGPDVTEFEAAFADYCQTDGCVGVANGTDALELLLCAMGIGPGDEVILPGNTFVATAEAVCAVSARPRFVDVRADTLQIDPIAVEAAIGPATAAVIAVHMFGSTPDMAALSAVTTAAGVALVEDAAQAHGAQFAGRRVGTFGIAAAFSFYPGKNLGALGDGGAVVSGDLALLDRIRRQANHGRSTADRHRHDLVGRNSRLDTIQAAVLLAKLKTLDADNERRVAAIEHYRTQLPDEFSQLVVQAGCASVHHLAVVRTADRDRATDALDAAGIGWGIHYPVPCNAQPAFAEFSTALSEVDRAATEILSLPLWPQLREDQISRVCQVLAEASER